MYPSTTSMADQTVQVASTAIGWEPAGASSMGGWSRQTPSASSPTGTEYSPGHHTSQHHLHNLSQYHQSLHAPQTAYAGGSSQEGQSPTPFGYQNTMIEGYLQQPGDNGPRPYNSGYSYTSSQRIPSIGAAYGDWQHQVNAVPSTSNAAHHATSLNDRHLPSPISTRSLSTSAATSLESPMTHGFSNWNLSNQSHVPDCPAAMGQHSGTSGSTFQSQYYQPQGRAPTFRTTNAHMEPLASASSRGHTSPMDLGTGNTAGQAQYSTSMPLYASHNSAPGSSYSAGSQQPVLRSQPRASNTTRSSRGSYIQPAHTRDHGYSSRYTSDRAGR